MMHMSNRDFNDIVVLTWSANFTTVTSKFLGTKMMHMNHVSQSQINYKDNKFKNKKIIKKSTTWITNNKIKA